MSRIRALAQLLRADFLERTRRHGFLVTLGFTVYAAYLFLPAYPSRYATLRLGEYRGIYNSAWVGSLVAMLSVAFLSLAGFYLVKNAVERDRRTGVGQILAATPLSRPVYLLGKLASNFTVLATMVAVLCVAAAAMQWVRGEDPILRPAALLAPFILLTLPVMAVVAAVAVCFEVAPGLRGGLGNVVYFFLWAAGLSLMAGGGSALDPMGGGFVLEQMQAACAAAYRDYDPDSGLSMGFNFRSDGLWDPKTFVWSGVVWTPSAIAGRCAWVAASVGLTLLVAPFFDRFDAGPAAGRGAIGARPARRPAWGVMPRDRRAAGAAEAPAGAAEVTAGPTAAASSSGRIAGLVAAEIRIMLQGVSRWWYLVALGLALACLFVPLPAVRGFLVPIALVWPLLVWSPMGSREAREGTRDLLFSTPRPLSRLLVAQWLAGATVALAAGSGALVRFALAGQGESLLSLVAAAVFIPSLALALGSWSGSGKLFEVIYLVLWYAGPMNRIPALDYLGATGPRGGPAAAATVLLLGAALAALAVAGRRRQLLR